MQEQHMMAERRASNHNNDDDNVEYGHPAVNNRRYSRGSSSGGAWRTVQRLMHGQKWLMVGIVAMILVAELGYLCGRQEPQACNDNNSTDVLLLEASRQELMKRAMVRAVTRGFTAAMASLDPQSAAAAAAAARKLARTTTTTTTASTTTTATAMMAVANTTDMPTTAATVDEPAAATNATDMLANNVTIAEQTLEYE